MSFEPIGASSPASASPRKSTTFAAVVVGLLLVAVLGCEEDAAKPLWWPGEPPEVGQKWPPPRPDGWPEGKAWPPVREAGENGQDPEDPGFWTELYGKDLDAENDDSLENNGGFGNYRFAKTFPRYEVGDPNTRPGCGNLFTVHRREATNVDSCEPFPEATIRGQCANVLNERAALDDCRQVCIRNSRCRQARIHPPPHFATWHCMDYPSRPEQDPQVDPGSFAQCAATILCECTAD